MADLTFEQALKRLEEIVEALETDDLDLDKSLQFFEEGVNPYHSLSSTTASRRKTHRHPANEIRWDIGGRAVCAAR